MSKGTPAGGATAPISIARLREFSIQVLTAMDIPEADAGVISDCLLFSEVRGHSSHGIVRLPVYGKRVVAGVVEPQPKVSVATDSGALAIVDGGNGLGPVVGVYAMDQAIARARKNGVGLVLAMHSNHYGAAGFYTSRATAAGCVGFSASNAPPNMAPWGGRERFLGTNPFSIGIPREEGVLNADMASSVVARGNIILAAQNGEPIPEGWAIDPDGRPTTDAEAGLKGSVLPFAGPKGAAISFMIDVMCGVLSGASYGRHLNTLEDLTTVQNLGQMFLAINVGSCLSPEAFDTRITDLVDQMKATPKAEGVAEILAPGEPEERSRSRGESAGVTLPLSVRDDIVNFAATVGVPAPAFLSEQ